MQDLCQITYPFWVSPLIWKMRIWNKIIRLENLINCFHPYIRYEFFKACNLISILPWLTIQPLEWSSVTSLAFRPLELESERKAGPRVLDFQVGVSQCCPLAEFKRDGLQCSTSFNVQWQKLVGGHIGRWNYELGTKPTEVNVGASVVYTSCINFLLLL